MTNQNMLKSYSLNIDFLDYEKKRDVTRNIVYSEGDINTAFIYATLTKGSEVINLEGHVVAVGIKNNEGEYLVNGCEVVDAKQGKISIPFSSTALSQVGFNKFEISIYKGEQKLVSPMFVYRVTESVTNGDSLEDSNNYDVLLVLISQVQGALDDVKEVADRVEGLEQSMIDNEADRKVSESIRIENENARLSNEILRQQQEINRELIFNQKIQEINELTDDIKDDLDNKLVEVDTELTRMLTIFNERVSTVDAKIQEVDDKLVGLDAEVATIINTKFDGKMEELNSRIDSSIDEKTTAKFQEVDTTLSQKLSEQDKKVDDKVFEASQAIVGVSDKINEMNTTIDKNVKKVDDKIDEVNIVKTQLINDVNEKIVEVDETKIDLTTSIGNKMDEFEHRFSELESGNPTGEITQSRISLDGTIHDTLSKRLKYDYDKKAGVNIVYTKSEIDSMIGDITSIDDSVVSTRSTWSSSKISGELGGKVSKTNGKDLSSNDYTNEDKAKLSGLSNYTHPNDENTRHVTDAEKSTWDNKANGNHTHNQYSPTTHQHSYSELNDKPNIPNKVSELQNDLGFVTRSDIHTHSNKETIDKITQAKLDSWDNKSNFSGNYNDLTNKPTIDVDKAYVDGELSKKANSSSVYTKDEVDDIVANATSIDDANIVTNATWSSSKINTEISSALSSIPKNLAYDKLVTTSEWKEDVEGLYFNITHNIGTSRIFISAIDNETKDGILMAYRVVDNNTVRISSVSRMDAFVTIVNGDNQIQASEDSDTKKNLVFDQTVTLDDWIMENGLATVLVCHKLFTEKVLVSAISTDTKESINVAFKILDDSKVKVSISNPMNALITVFNGDKELLQIDKTGSEISDSITSSGTTWSSSKIQSEIVKATSVKINWSDIEGKPESFNPTPHNHNEQYYQKSEVDSVVEPIDNGFIDGLFNPQTISLGGVKYYTAEEIDSKIGILIEMINKLK